jgi:hypothetical protein
MNDVELVFAFQPKSIMRYGGHPVPTVAIDGQIGGHGVPTLRTPCSVNGKDNGSI